MNNDRTWYIYILKDPRSEDVRYVGWSYDVAQRLSAHISSAPKIKSHKAHWIKQLLNLGLRPIIEVIEFGNGDWREAEQRWISHYKKAGANLTNMTDGGDGTPGCFPNEETRRKMSAAQTGRKQTAESIAKTKTAITGRKQSPEHVRKLSEARKGKAPIVATEAAAKANRGKKQSADHVAKRMLAHIGKPKLSQRKLTDSQVREIRSLIGKVSMKEIAKRYGVGATTIFEIKHGTSYGGVND